MTPSSFWRLEFMSLTSWLLVLSTHREAETPRGAHVYLVMASFGTACLLLCFGMLAGYRRGLQLRRHPRAFPGRRFRQRRGAAGPAGAGSKAGLVPLHVWLPLAVPPHPAMFQLS